MACRIILYRKGDPGQVPGFVDYSVWSLDGLRPSPDTDAMDEPASIEYALLGLLYEGPLHGYELYRRYSDRSGLAVVWKVKRSRFYAILARLGSIGLVEMEVRIQQGRPPRKIFRLTPKGQSALRAWMMEPVADSREFRVEFPAKLYFCARTDPLAARALVSKQRAVCETWLRLRRVEAGDRAFESLVRRFREGQLRAMSLWLSDCEAYLDGRKAAEAVPELR